MRQQRRCCHTRTLGAFFSPWDSNIFLVAAAVWWLLFFVSLWHKFNAMEKRNIKLKDLEVNNGQIFGLPKNPRLIRDRRFASLKKSIEDAPEMLAYRTLLVFPNNGKFVIICGNMRYRACKDLGYAELPCSILPEDTPVAKLREYTIKDNVGFGSDDMDALANEWESNELIEWGMEIDRPFSSSEEPIKEEELRPYTTSHILISYPPERHQDVISCIEALLNDEEIEINSASNG